MERLISSLRFWLVIVQNTNSALQYNTVTSQSNTKQSSTTQHSRVQGTDVLRIGLAAVPSARLTGITKPTLLCSVPTPDCDDDNGCIPSEESAVLSVGSISFENNRKEKNREE
jgi:hypothetical protein